MLVPSRFPGIGADLTLTHAVEVSWERIVEAVHSEAPEDLIDFRLKDRYTGVGVPDGAVSTTISFHYNARDRSLTQEEINDRQTALARALEEGLGWDRARPGETGPGEGRSTQPSRRQDV